MKEGIVYYSAHFVSSLRKSFCVDQSNYVYWSKEVKPGLILMTDCICHF